MPPKFFLTHSWNDIDFARRLCDDLTVHGQGGFFDAYSIKPGDFVIDEITRGLEACEVYVPILSLAAMKSRWCKEEINAAITLSNTPGRNGRPRIVPVLIEDCASEMPIFLRTRLYIEFTDRYSEAFKELLAKVFGVSETATKQQQEVSPVGSEPELKEAISPANSESEPKDASGYLSRGSIDRIKGDVDPALADYTKAIDLDEKNARAHASRGATYRMLEKYDQALVDLNRAIELDPKDGWALAQRGETHRMLEKYDQALADLNRAIELDPKYAWALATRGATYRMLEKYDQALIDLNHSIELDPRDAWALAQRGETHRILGKYDQALADLNRAIELDPKYAYAYHIRGMVYNEKHRY